ncbi:MAG: plasmid recombination protein [Ruminococcus flavefaciens]|nr:plasmid recombination protein [Ruminococcus flavefaciens]
MDKYYQNKFVVRSPSEQRKLWGLPREKHATISVITHKETDFANVDSYLAGCKQQFQVDYIKHMRYPAEQAWDNVMALLNAQFNKRGKNVVLECLQFGGNKEFWDSFPNKYEIEDYFKRCYSFAVDKVGCLHTDENIIYVVIVTEPNRRNLFAYCLPITDKWQVKVMSNCKSKKGNKLQQYDKSGNPIYNSMKNMDKPRLSHSEFWKQRGGLVSYSALQEDFYTEVSKVYETKRGVSLSLIKNTTLEQKKRFNRHASDEYDELYYNDMPYG